MKINILIPVYNEEGLIAGTLSRLFSEVKLPYRAIIINDGSMDKTESIVRTFLLSHPDTFVLFNQSHLGFSSAIKQGLALVPENETFVVVMADGCDEVRLIEDMHSRIVQGQADVVCACRYMPAARRIGGSIVKAIGSRFVNLFFSLRTKGQCRDMTNSFKMFKKDVLRNTVIEAKGFDISLELALKAYLGGYRINDIPTIWTERGRGKSKFHIIKDGLVYIRWIWLSLRGGYKAYANN